MGCCNSTNEREHLGTFPPPRATCVRGHDLIPLRGENIPCSVCRSVVNARRERVAGCRECGFALCEDCLGTLPQVSSEGRQPATASTNANVRIVPIIPPVSPQSPLLHEIVISCPTGHELRPVLGPNNWWCDGCSRGVTRNHQEFRYRCAQCDFDVCQRCERQIRERQSHAQSENVDRPLSNWRAPQGNSDDDDDDDEREEAEDGEFRCPWCHEQMSFDSYLQHRWPCIRRHRRSEERAARRTDRLFASGSDGSSNPGGGPDEIGEEQLERFISLLRFLMEAEGALRQAQREPIDLSPYSTLKKYSQLLFEKNGCCRHKKMPSRKQPGVDQKAEMVNDPHHPMATTVTSPTLSLPSLHSPRDIHQEQQLQEGFPTSMLPPRSTSDLEELHEQIFHDSPELFGNAAILEQIETCIICQENYQLEDEVRQITKCAHVFHKGCIDTWFEAHDTCPICRCQPASENVAAQQTAVSE